MPALAFYKAPGNLLDRAIRCRTCSPYSHVEYLPFGGELGGEAVAWSSSSRDGGVRCKRIEFRADRWDLVEISVSDEGAVMRRFAGERGKKYDYLGVLVGRSLGLPIHHENRWFCSELIAHALGLSHPSNYTPGSLARELQSGELLRRG